MDISTSRKRRAIAKKIVAAIFTNGCGEKAGLLSLVLPDGRPGGRMREPLAIDRVVGMLAELHFEQAAKRRP